jgi:rubrerythrin
VNFASRNICNRCGAGRPFDEYGGLAAQDYSREEANDLRSGDLRQPPVNGRGGAPIAGRSSSGAPVAGVDGNWACSECHNVNFASRSHCNRCGAPRPQPAYSERSLRSGGAPVAGVDGNWQCKYCGNVNFAVRSACNKCMMPRENADLQQAPPPQRRTGGAPIAGENGNWACPACGNVNFASRDACNRCQAPKPQDLVSDADLIAQLSQPADFDEPRAKRVKIS